MSKDGLSKDGYGLSKDRLSKDRLSKDGPSKDKLSKVISSIVVVNKSAPIVSMSCWFIKSLLFGKLDKLTNLIHPCRQTSIFSTLPFIHQSSRNSLI